jgi:hypothetical protein
MLLNDEVVPIEVTGSGAKVPVTMVHPPFIETYQDSNLRSHGK